jgi:hypothetical protein
MGVTGVTTWITFACLRRLDNVFGKDHLSRRRVFFGARGRFTGLHSTPCVDMASHLHSAAGESLPYSSAAI